MRTFAAWSTLHAIVLAVIALAVAEAVVLRRRAAARNAATVERAVAAGYVALWIGTFAWLRTTPGFDPSTDQPLQLCHWTAIVCALALALRWRAFSALAYFWGLALCSQALVTPNLREGPATWPFWFFWTTHALCVGVPLYDVLARRYRPDWRDCALAMLAAAGYVAIVLPIDLATGWNYGFVGPSRPDVPTLVDALGPWPGRLLAIAGLAGAAMALALAPWAAKTALTRTREPSPRAPRA